MRPLTDHTPKPLLQAGGKALIVWHLERLAAAGFREIVINHAHLGTQIEAALGDGSAFGLAITYCAEPAGALETAGGVVNALPQLGQEPFLVISADIYAECDYGAMAGAAQELCDGTLAYLWMVENPAWHAAGDFVLRGDHLRMEGGPKLTYSNIGIYSPAFFAGVSPGTRLPMFPLFKQAIAAGKVKAARYHGLWDNVGNPAQLEALDATLRRRRPLSTHSQ